MYSFQCEDKVLNSTYKTKYVIQLIIYLIKYGIDVITCFYFLLSYTIKVSSIYIEYSPHHYDDKKRFIYQNKIWKFGKKGSMFLVSNFLVI